MTPETITQRVLIALIRTYQYVLSPWLGTCCRFEPSCSRYANEAICAHGVWRGTLLTIKRLLRCQPFAAAGYDPVPHHQTRKDM